MKAYLAGKITGDKEYKEKFRRAAEMLEARGYTVLNPATLPEGMDQQDYMQLCTQMLFAADVAAFLPDYICSRGACIEYGLCLYIGKSVMLLEKDEEGYHTNGIKKA